jgi:hypothetical protein
MRSSSVVRAIVPPMPAGSGTSAPIPQGASRQSTDGQSGGGGSQSGITSTLATSSQTRSIEKAMEEIKVERIARKEPVRKMGESGHAAKFSANYVKLKCKNLGVYQYVVQYDPPVDSQYIRIKLLHSLSEAIGTVRLFDGHTLFLPKLLPDKVCLFVF